MEVINTNFENWGSYLLKQFHSMYEKGERCDLEISCNDQIFLVHRLIMSVCSDYVKELNDKQHIILPKEVSCKTMKTVINFVYSGKISFKKDEKEELLLAASLLNMGLLTELIKPEESGPYTLHMDDEEGEEHATEVAGNEISAENSEDCDLNNSQQQHNQASYLLGAKRKAETRNNKSKHSKHNAVLPPLHKFPYLQQKYSASRTYGLITKLTSPVPSRFEIPDTELQNIAYRSTFENVTYETGSLFKDPDSAAPLDEAHHQFLKKLKDNSGHRRCYSNALYSPFDKFAPPSYSMKSDSSNKRSESVISYPSKVDAATARKQQTHHVLETRSLSKPAASKSSPSTASKEYRKSSLQPTNNSSSLNVSTEKHVRFADRIDIHEIDVDFAAEQVDNDLECLPDPITPSEIVQGPSLINDDNDKVELIKLNNAVVPSVSQEHVNMECPRMEETPFISISLVNALPNYPITATTPETKDEPSYNDSIQDTIETQPEISITNAEQTTAADLSSYDEVSSTVTFVEEDILSDTVPSKERTSASTTIPIDGHTTNSESSSVSHSSSNLLTNATIFTPLNTASSDSSMESSSQIFALKVKGTENSDQLNRLVDMCKQNPLFKNKNLRFKLVPVKSTGAIQEKLKDHTLIGAGINKAIIVKRSETAIGTITPLTAAVAKEPNQSRKCGQEEENLTKKENKNSHIENVSGPWECTTCTESDGQGKVFGTYFEYRTHQHSVHDEANNPIFCIHCGYKSLKRNVQLYHLFTKHNVPPPSNVTFPKCDKCEFHALNEFYLQKHLACHPSMGMEYVCSCKVAFKSSELLQKHMVSGDCRNSRSFTCGYCRVIFDRYVNLKAHMRVCMKERSKPMLDNNTDRSLKSSI